MFLKNKNIISKIRRLKVTDYAALNCIHSVNVSKFPLFPFAFSTKFYLSTLLHKLSICPCLEVIKLEYSPKLKIKRNDWLQSAMIGCLRTRVCKQPIVALYFESKNELKFYNLEALSLV